MVYFVYMVAIILVYLPFFNKNVTNLNTPSHSIP